MAALRLSELKPLKKKRKRIGRGGSRGSTSGRGHKGQKARTGDHAVGLGFEGGQMPLVRRLPKRGFNNTEFATRYSIVNLKDLEQHFAHGAEITPDILCQQGMIKFKKGGIKSRGALVKILGTGVLTKKFAITADAFSESARKIVENAGGTIQLTKRV